MEINGYLMTELGELNLLIIRALMYGVCVCACFRVKYYVDVVLYRELFLNPFTCSFMRTYLF